MSENLNNLSLDQILKYFFNGKDFPRVYQWNRDNAKNDPDRIRPEELEKILNFFEKKGAKGAYSKLFKYGFENEEISREKFIYAATHNLVNCSTLDIRKMAELYNEKNYAREDDIVKLKNFFLKIGNKGGYSTVTTYLIKTSTSLDLDYEIIKGLVSINRLGPSNQVTLFKGSHKPKILYQLIKNKQKFLFAAFGSITENINNFEILVKLSRPEIENMLSGDTDLALKVCEQILYDNESMRQYIKKYYCPAISKLIERITELKKLPFPLRLPLFTSCHEKFKAHGKFDYVSKPDEWDQRRVKQGIYYGVIDANDKIIVKPQYRSISEPAMGSTSGVRKALKGDKNYPYHRELVYLTRTGKELNPSGKN